MKGNNKAASNTSKRSDQPKTASHLRLLTVEEFEQAKNSGPWKEESFPDELRAFKDINNEPLTNRQQDKCIGVYQYSTK